MQTVLDLGACGIDISLDDTSSASSQALGRILGSPMLRSLDLSGNAISGTLSPRLFPNASASASGLESLNLGANRIGGAVPVEWCTQLVNLRALYLNDNALNGTFPALAFGTLVQLRVRKRAPRFCWRACCVFVSIICVYCCADVFSVIFAIRSGWRSASIYRAIRSCRDEYLRCVSSIG